MGHSGPTGRPDVAAAIAALDPGTAGEAKAAMDWMLPEDRDWADLTQLGLQSFLWYELPTKWMSQEDHHHEVARALGDLFASVGMDRHAALCRSEETHRLIARWETDRESARAQLRRLMERSGVNPLDTDALTWGDVQGVEENDASWRTSRALEAAIDDGRLVPGSRGWRRVAEEVARSVLSESASADDPRAVVDVVEAERRDFFLDRVERGGVALGAELRALLVWDERGARDEQLAQVGQTLEPLRWLLTEIGDGVRLTQAGYLPKALALAADARYDWFGLKPRFSVRGERDLPELSELRDLARECRLVTVRKQTVSLSARGRATVDDPMGLARVVLAWMLAPRTWRGDAGLAVAVALLSQPQGGSALLRSDLDNAVLTHLAPRWRSAGGDGTVTPRDAAMASGDVLRTARVFGWVESDRHLWQQAPGLTSSGRVALLTALRLAAIAARNSL